MMTKSYFSKSKRSQFIHRYERRLRHSLEKYTFWGIRLEALFRGFTHREMFEIEAEIRHLIMEHKRRIMQKGELREVELHCLVTKPFKDELVM